MQIVSEKELVVGATPLLVLIVLRLVLALPAGLCRYWAAVASTLLICLLLHASIFVLAVDADLFSSSCLSCCWYLIFLLICLLLPLYVIFGAEALLLDLPLSRRTVPYPARTTPAA